VLWSWARGPVAFLSLVVWATTMQHFAPARRSRWRDDLPGGCSRPSCGSRRRTA
jgi:hypothetical protein